MFWLLDFRNLVQKAIKFRICFQIIFIIIFSLNRGKNYTNCKLIHCTCFFLILWVNFRIGDELFVLLLTECSIFVCNPLGSKTLLQIAGKPLSDESVKSANSAIPSTSKIANVTLINRSRILYGSPVCPGNTNVIGLSHKRKCGALGVFSIVIIYILDSFNCKSGETRNSAKLVFNCSSKRGWQGRRLEILSQEMLKKHQKCPYAPIYAYYTKIFDNCGQLSRYQVFGFLISVFKRILPSDFVKNSSFMRHFRKILWTFLRMPRFEKICTSELIFGFPLKEILPIFDPKSKAFQTPSEHEKIKFLFGNFMTFIFENLVIDLLRSNFYISETAASRSRLVFYRHDTWARLTKPMLEVFQETMFQPVTGGSRIEIKARCRLVPKENGRFRPIMAFKKPPSTEEGNRLRASFDILKYFHEIDESLSVMGFSSLQTRLLQYKSSCNSSGPFYLAKLDISACFDSIPHEKLFELLANLLEKREFSVRRVDQIQLDMINKRPLKRITRIARGNIKRNRKCKRSFIPLNFSL